MSSFRLTGNSDIRIQFTKWVLESRLVRACEEGEDYRFGFNNYEKLNEVSGIGNTIDFGARIYDSRLGRFNSTDAYEKQYPSLSPYSFSFNSPITFKDNNGDSVKIFHSNKMVGFTQINLYSSSEIKKAPSRRNAKVWVPVYEVTVSNESGSSATFYFTRYNERARINQNNKIEDVTFDVRKSGDSYEGIKKKRWSKTNYDVLELRTIGRSSRDDQWISGMKSYKFADRQAIQYHAKGASDGCLLCAPENQITPLDGVEIDAEGTGTQSEFMRTIEKFQKEDKKNGKSDFIEVEFERTNYYMPGSSGSQDLQKTKEFRENQKSK